MAVMDKKGNVLIIKLGALGDVLRTTSLLRRLSGRITWVTGRECLPLLAQTPRIQRLVPLAEASSLRRLSFDRVINFDEDPRACRLAAAVAARRRTGAWTVDGRIAYCAASAPWFDMSLISRLGREAADQIKARGRRSYQDYLFAACGLRFHGEEYVLPLRPARAEAGVVALESRVGEQWPAKAWGGYAALRDSLREEGFRPVELRPRRRLADYLDDINRAGIVVTGDTLAMHVGLALRKKVIALFTCTSPDEIHGYGRLIKLVDARLLKNFYRRDRAPGAASTISPGEILRAVRLLRTHPPRFRGGGAQLEAPVRASGKSPEALRFGLRAA